MSLPLLLWGVVPTTTSQIKIHKSMDSVDPVQLALVGGGLLALLTLKSLLAPPKMKETTLKREIKVG